MPAVPEGRLAQQLQSAPPWHPFRFLPSSPSGVLTPRFSATAVRGSSSHRLGFCTFCCFDVSVFWCVFHFCLESLSVTAAWFLRKSVLEPPQVPVSPSASRPGGRVRQREDLPSLLLFQLRGGAGASRPRSARARSRGPPAKTAGRGASPATRGRTRRKTSSSCDGPAPQKSPHRALGGRRAAQGSPSPPHSPLGAFLAFSFFLFLKTKPDPFLGNQSTSVWASPSPRPLISQHSFLCLQRTPAGTLGHT